MDGSSARREEGRPKLSLIKPERGYDPSADLSAAHSVVLDDIKAQAKNQGRFALIEPVDVEDIVQQTMLAMWKRLKANPRLWTDEAEGERNALQFKITANAIVNLRRYTEAMRGREPDEAIDVDSVASTGRSPHDRVERKEFFHALARALERVAPRARQLWCFKHLDDLTVTEIANQEGSTVDAVSVSLYKTNIALRPMMRAEGYAYPRESKP